MRMTDLPPALVLFAGALLLTLVRGRARWVVALSAPLLALAGSWAVIQEGAHSTLPFLGFTLNPVYVHAATPAFATVFCVALAGGMLFALSRHRPVELPAAMVYAGGALGVVFSGDLISMFVFWEIMTLGSTVVIWSGGMKRSYGSGMRYFGLHAVGGVMLLVGIIMVVGQRAGAGDPDPVAFSHLAAMADNWHTLNANTAGMWLMMIGMLVNAGAPPFSAWIADAYPEGSASGSVFLSAFTTKTAVFTLLVAFAGVDVLIYIGLYMALYGVVYAVLENDIRRILAYSIVTQVGFMLIGIGIGTPLALAGVVAHAFAHILYKSVLMMAAGSVIDATGKRRFTDLGGLYRAMPVALGCAIVGVLTVGGLPLTAGYVTKPMIMEGATAHANALSLAGGDNALLIVSWFVMKGAGVAAFVFAGVLFLWFLFFNDKPDPVPAKHAGESPWNMRAAMVMMAGLCLLVGVFPSALYALLPHGDEVAGFAGKVYGFEKIFQSVELAAFGVLAFFVLSPLLKRREIVMLDFDWIWRRFVPTFWHEVVRPILKMMESAQRTVLEWFPGRGMDDDTLPPQLRRRLPGSWAVSVPVLLITLMLLAYLMMYFWLLPGEA